MKSKISFIIFAVILFAACQSEETIKLDNIMLNEVNTDFIVKNGRIVFTDINSYMNTYQSMTKYNNKQLSEWSKKVGIIPLQASYNKKENESNENEDINLNELQGPLAYIYNKDGVLQYSNTILVIKDEKIISINDGSEGTLEAILEGRDVNSMKNIIVANHSRLLDIKANNSISGPMKVWENSSMYYTSNRIRYFAEFKAISLQFAPPIYNVSEFYITGMKQNRFLGVWWAPTQFPIKNSSIKYTGTINNQNFNFPGPGVMRNPNQLFAGVGPYVVYPSPPAFNMTVTYVFELNGIPHGGSRTINYAYEP